MSFKEIDVEELSKIIDSGSGRNFIDVREPDEFVEVRAKGTKNLPLSVFDPTAFESNTGIKKDEPVYVICKMGGRSARACELLAEVGYTDLTNIAGGTMAWVNSSLPQESGE